MQTGYHRRTSCRLCEADDLEPVLALTPTPPANELLAEAALAAAQDRFALDLHLCRRCGHLQLVDVVDPVRLFERYVYVSGTSPVFVKHFEDYANEVVARFGLGRGERAIDIGSNDGVLLRALARHGMAVLGIDPALDIAARATEAGIPTRAAFFSSTLAAELAAELGPARLITANNVFAHSDGLADIAAGIAQLLDARGVFAFEVSYLVDVYEKNLFDTIYHEHLAYHAVRPLLGFFERHALEVFDVERVSSHGGSIRVYVQPVGGPQPRSARVDEAIAHEELLGLFDPATYAGWLARIEAEGQALREALAGLRAAGKTVAGFGAPAKATTLLHQFGIGAETIDYIIDDSPWKQGLYLPGLGIPIVSADVLATDPPDCLVVLAWNFADPIIQRHQGFVDDGGCFVVPLPELRAVPDDAI